MTNMKLRSIAIASVAFMSAANGLAGADQLEGHVKQNVSRISRPDRPGLSEQATAVKTTLNGFVTDDSFKLNARAAGQAQAPAAAPIEPAKIDQTPLAGHANEDSAKAPILPAAISAQPPSTFSISATQTAQPAVAATSEGAKGKSEQPLVDDYNAKPPLKGKVTFRFCYYDLGDGAECAWEGLRDANYLLGRGADISIMLDRGGVRMANKHNMHEYQLHRGSTEKLIATQQLLRTFIEKGGKVYASERWSKQFGLTGDSYPALTAGVTLLNDEEMADMLVERDGRIVEY